MKNITGTIAEKKGMLYTVIFTYDIEGKRHSNWEKTGLKSKGNKTKAKEILTDRIATQKKKSADEAMATMIKSDTVTVDIPFYKYIDVWLNYVKSRVDTVTFQGYVNYAKNHVVPYFKVEGSTITEINRKKIQKFIDFLAREGNVKTNAPLSYSSVKKIKTVVKQTLDKAVKDEIITFNPCNLIDMPRNEKREPTFLTANEVNRFLDCIKDEKIYPMIKLDITYGLRRSELIGLKWQNIDFENNKIYIRHTISRVNNQSIAKDKTKNQSSRRTICISEDTKNLLLKMKEEQDKNRKLLGSYYIESDYVFTWEDGKLIDVSYPSRKLGQLLKKYGFKHIRFHDLRHSCASILLSAGYELKDVQELLGHSEISMTADLYGHLDDTRKRNIADAMSALIS